MFKSVCRLFSFFHIFVKLKLVILFSRSISFFPIFNRVMKNYTKLPRDPTPNSPLPRLPVLQLDVPLLERGGTSWLGGTWGDWGYVGLWGDGGMILIKKFQILEKKLHFVLFHFIFLCYHCSINV